MLGWLEELGMAANVDLHTRLQAHRMALTIVAGPEILTG